MQHWQGIDSFCKEEEHFFGSYEAEGVNAERSPTLELDSVEAQRPTAEQLAHFTRFRRPVAWVMAAMGSLSLAALGQHAFQHDSRRELVAHARSATAVPTSASARDLARVSALPRGAVFAGAAQQTAEAPGSWIELAENAIALVFESTPASPSSSKLPSLTDSAPSPRLVNDFTSALLAMCRDTRSWKI